MTPDPPESAGASDIDAAPEAGLGDVTWLRRYRYEVLSAVVVVLLGIQTVNQQWSTDVWLHAAALKALLVDLGDPGSPVLSLDAPHTHYSPYTVVLAAVGGRLGLGPVGLLTLAAFANLLLLLGALRLFVRSLGCRDGAAFWTLMFTLLLWGIGPWRWSGYLHADSIGFALPYPSTFATAVALLLAVVLRRYLDRGRWEDLALLAVGVPTVILTHPPTALWLALLCVAIVVASSWSARRAAGLAAAALVTLGLLALWPYYPAFEVPAAFGGSAPFEASNRELVEALGSRLGLALLFGIPPLVARLRRDRRDVLVVSFALVLGAVLVAVVGETYWLARVVPLGVLALHVSLADWVSSVEPATPGTRRRPWTTAVAVALVAGLVVGAVSLRAGFIRMVPRPVGEAVVGDDPRIRPMTEPWDGLVAALPADAVVGATGDPSIELPGLAGSFVASSHWNEPFVDDEVEAERRADARSMVSPTTPPQLRRRLLDRYGVTHLVVPTSTRGLGDAGDVVASSDDWLLIEVSR